MGERVENISFIKRDELPINTYSTILTTYRLDKEHLFLSDEPRGVAVRIFPRNSKVRVRAQSDHLRNLTSSQ